MPREQVQSKRFNDRGYQARAITRSISTRTSRSTSGGRLLSSHSFSNGLISSRTRSAMVGPPLNTCARSDVSARTRLVTEPAAALAVSADARPMDVDKEALMGEISDFGGVAAGTTG